METAVEYLPILKSEFHGEGWKLIPNLPNCYEISTIGRIRYSIGAKKVIYPTEYRNNNVYVTLNINPKEKKEFKLVDLVLIAFRPDYFVGCKILYKDGNRRNCAVDNIKWKQPKAYHSSNNVGLEKWKCSNKAASANTRYKDTTSEKITQHEVYRALEIMQFKCFYCGDDLDANRWQLDHYTPVSKGGTNRFNNLACSCQFCNIMKGDFYHAPL